MRAGLFYSLFVFLTLLIVSSEQKDKKQTFGDISSCQSVNVNKCNDCLVIAINFSLKKPILEFNAFRFINEKLLQKAYDQKIRLSLTYQRLYQSKSFDLKTIKRDFRVSLHYTTEKEDDHHLS